MTAIRLFFLQISALFSIFEKRQGKPLVTGMSWAIFYNIENV